MFTKNVNSVVYNDKFKVYYSVFLRNVVVRDISRLYLGKSLVIPPLD